MSSPLYFDAKTRQPHMRPQRRRRAIQLPDGNIVEPPTGMTVEQYARALDIKLKPKPRDRRPPPGVPPTEELHMTFADRDTSLDSSYDTIIYESGSTTSRAPAGIDRDDELIPLRQATRRYRNLIGNVKIVAKGGQRYVYRRDLDAFANKHRRGSRTPGSRNQGAAKVVSKEIENARAARRRAFEAGKRRS